MGKAANVSFRPPSIEFLAIVDFLLLSNDDEGIISGALFEISTEN
jgi:hypothetical protein